MGVMTHSKAQHGGWAAQAKRRGEEYALCATCGQRRHPRLTHAQPAEEVERWGPVKTAVVTIFAIALIVALGLVAGIGHQVTA